MKARIKGIGTYSIKLDTCFCFDLENCLYVPECSRNLASASRLDILGFNLKIGNEYFLCIIKTPFCGYSVLLDTLYCFNLNADFVNSLFNVMSEVSVKGSAPNESLTFLWRKKA